MAGTAMPPDPAEQAVQYTRAHAMTDDALATRTRHNAHVVPAIAALMAKPNVSQDDLVMFLHGAMKRDIMTSDQAGDFFNHLPKDAQKLKAALNHMHQTALHARTLLRAEEHRRRQS